MGEMYFRIRHEEGMGFGDVKMLAMIGAFLGWKLMLLTLVLSSFMGSIVGVAMIAIKRGDMKYALPFGTFLAVGAMSPRRCRRLDRHLVRRRSTTDDRPESAMTCRWTLNTNAYAIIGLTAIVAALVGVLIFAVLPVCGGRSRFTAAPPRQQHRKRICHGCAARCAGEAEGAGTRDVGAGRSLRAPQQ